ncbi:MAG: response regulator [Gammaproteobacteria bacterium]|nr:response regulator [Gammaproteobacteria bacterium]
MPQRVLIAEDEPHIVESLRFILDLEGYEVRTVIDGREVVDAVRRYMPNVVILDVMMPNRNGFEVLKSLKADSELASVPVLMLTAKGQERDRATALGLGADVFVTKPFSNRDVLDRVRRLAGPRPQRIDG